MIHIGHYTKRVIIVGVVSLLVLASGSYLFGALGGYEAKKLLNTSLTGIQTLCNTVVLASATILALLLTLLGLSSGSDSRLKKDHYRHVLQIAKTDTMVFIVAMVTMVAFNLPVTESDKIPPDWYMWVYYLAIFMMSLVSSALIVVVYMLYNTVKNIIKIVGLGVSDHPLVEDEEDD